MVDQRHGQLLDGFKVSVLRGFSRVFFSFGFVLYPLDREYRPGRPTRKG